MSKHTCTYETLPDGTEICFECDKVKGKKKLSTKSKIGFAITLFEGKMQSSESQTKTGEHDD